MSNYKIEGNINFYEALYSSLDYDSSNEDTNNEDIIDNKQKICEISGQALTTHFVTLECKHSFNYDALYTEICKQKFDFQSYTTDVLSKKDLQTIRDNKLDYYIKCPYCRHIQFDLLPYFDYRVVKTSYVPYHGPSNGPSSYVFNLYGYTFAKGICCKINTNINNGKQVPCYNSYATEIVAPDGLVKMFCPNHVRQQVKDYKLEIKKKKIEDQLVAKEVAKAAALEAKLLKSGAVKKELKELKPNNLCLSCGCIAILKTGTKKGQACGLKVFCDLNVGETNNTCKRHLPK